MTETCQECAKPLAYKGTGRPPRYCSRRCKRRAERQRATSSARFRPPQPAVSPEQRAALERVRLAEEQLRAAVALRAALARPKPDPLDPPHVFRTFTGEQWLAERHGAGFTPGPDTAATADEIARQHGTPDQRP
jgi:hypothetical protein